MNVLLWLDLPALILASIIASPIAHQSSPLSVFWWSPWVVAGTTKTIDMLGHAQAYKYWKPSDQKDFFLSITSHVRKSVDYVAIDLKGASKEQIAQITEYVNKLTKAERDKIIYISP